MAVFSHLKILYNEVKLCFLDTFEDFTNLAFDCGNFIKMKDPCTLNSNLKDALDEVCSIHMDPRL